MRETLRGGAVSLFKRSGPEIGIVLFLAFLCSLFFWRIITPDVGDRAFFPGGDFTDHYYAFSLFQTRQIRGGHLPLWNPYAFGGHPFLADLQSAVFYPIRLMTILLSIPWGFSLYALELEAIFHFFLASLLTYGGYLTSYPALQLTILETDVWLPLLLLMVEIGWEREQWSYFVLAGLALGLALLAGHPQLSMYVVYASGAYFFFRSLGSGTSSFQRVKLFTLILLLGFGLAAIQLMPGVEYYLLSTRIMDNYREIAHGFPPHDLLHIVLPGSLATWSPLYVGILPLILAILALCLWRREVIFWGFLALLALLLSLGGATFLYPPFYLFVPGFGIFRSQERIAYIFSFAVAILAGYGTLSLIKSLSRAARSRLRAFNRALLLALVGTIALALLFLYGWLGKGLAYPKPFGHLLNRTILLGIFVAFSWGIIQLRLRGERRRVVLVSLILFATVFDLFTINWRTNLQEKNPEFVCTSQPLLGYILSDSGIFRVYNDRCLPGNYGLVCEVEDARGSSPLRLKRVEELNDKLPSERLWRLLNVKYVITWREALTVPTELLYQEGQGEETVYLHRLLDPGPRVRMIHQARVVGDGEALKLLVDRDFDPWRIALLPEEVELELPQREVVGSSARLLERQPTRLILEVDAVANGLLVLSEVYCPGWRAYVDGQEVKVKRVNYILRAIALERGHHRVELIYAPLTFKVGAAISMMTLAVVLWKGWQWRRWGTKP